MAIVLTKQENNHFEFELSPPEADWLKMVSQRCYWTAETTLAFAISSGLADLVEITEPVEAACEAGETGEVTR